jgi:hypothetical protein
VKTISDPHTKKRTYFSRCKESYRKDVERELGVFQVRFAIVTYHALTWFSPQMCVCVCVCGGGGGGGV